MKQLYRGCGDGINYMSLEEFARKRIRMSATLIEGVTDPAIQYYWAVSDDDGASYRNPTDDEQTKFVIAIGTIRAEKVNCRDNCSGRTRIDGFWQCPNCDAIWTHQTCDDRCDTHCLGIYGIRLSDFELMKHVTNLHREAPRIGPLMNGGIPVARKKLAFIRHEGLPAGWSRAIVDVKIDTDIISFLTVCIDTNDNLSNQWR